MFIRLFVCFPKLTKGAVVDWGRGDAGVLDCKAAGEEAVKELAGANGFPADDGEMELFREEGESVIGLANALGGAGIGATHGDECGARGGGSSGKVAEGTSEGFASDERGGGGGGEVDAFDHGIGF